MLGGHVARGQREVDLHIVAGDELEAKRFGSSGGAVLDGEDKGVLLPSNVEVGVAPRVEVAAPAKRLVGLAGFFGWNLRPEWLAKIVGA